MSDCLGCQHLENPHAKTVHLSSGAEVCNHCPAWRDECAARHTDALRVLQIPDRETRLTYIARVRNLKGDVAADRLAAEVLHIWNERRAARLAAPAQEAEQPAQA